MRILHLTVIAASALLGPMVVWSQDAPPKDHNAGTSLLLNSKQVLFLGDSITASGQYIAWFDAWLNIMHRDKAPRLINCGLPSETVSGLSEDGHAGGQFPRPDLAERLDRVLKEVKPNLVIACYGINCGIYQPFDQVRFARYQDGMKRLKEIVEKSGAKFVVMTPPFYDDQRSPKNGFSYNKVLDQYSAWLIEQRANGWPVIDLHGPMTSAVTDRRKSEPLFTMQPDGVHPNESGHWFIAQQLIAWAGDETSAKAESAKAMITAAGVNADLLSHCQQRMSVLRDAYIATAGHKRPGVAKGLPLSEAKAQASELTAKISDILTKAK